MARQPYNPTESLQNMTTRQLRQYIYEKSREAEERLKSMDLEDQPKAVKDAARAITYKNSRVMKSTSNMSKVEMVEHAFNLREFNMLDTASGYARKAEWQSNKTRYETFIRHRIEEGEYYWEQYLTPTGKVSKRGYTDYKDYINYLRSVEDVKYSYTYRTVAQYAEKTPPGVSKEKYRKAIADLLLKNYVENKNKGLSQAQLIERFEKKRDEWLEKEYAAQSKKADQSKKAKKKSPIKVKAKPNKSKSNIKTAKGRKMREHGTVRERLT